MCCIPTICRRSEITRIVDLSNECSRPPSVNSTQPVKCSRLTHTSQRLVHCQVLRSHNCRLFLRTRVSTLRVCQHRYRALMTLHNCSNKNGHDVNSDIISDPVHTRIYRSEPTMTGPEAATTCNSSSASKADGSRECCSSEERFSVGEGRKAGARASKICECPFRENWSGRF